jgi:hypothetical protein
VTLTAAEGITAGATVQTHADLVFVGVTQTRADVSSTLGTFTPQSVGNFLQVSGAASANNNSAGNGFEITAYYSATDVEIAVTAGVAPDANNGAITYIEKLKVTTVGGTMSLGTTNANAVDLGRTGKVTNVLGHLTAAQNLYFTKEVDHVITVVNSDITSTVRGGHLDIYGADGSANTNGYDGGRVLMQAGGGGAAQDGTDGNGGLISMTGGPSRAQPGSAYVTGGLGTSANSFGGHVHVDGGYRGNANINKTNGSVYIGETYAEAVNVGHNTKCAVTINGSSIMFQYGGVNALSIGAPVVGTSADVVIEAGVLLHTNGGTGNIDLPNNANAKFMIEGFGVGANVTAANLDELTGGGQTGLHSHAGVAGDSTKVTIENLNTSGCAVGDVAYVSSFSTVPVTTKAIATSMTAARAIGVVTTVNNATGKVQTQGVVPVKFDGGSAPTVGTAVYLSDDSGNNKNGMATSTAPTAQGSVISDIGTVMDVTGWAASGDTVKVLLHTPHNVLI